MTRDAYLKHLWSEIINAPLRGHWISNTIRTSEQDTEGPFSDVGDALKRMQATGVSEKDLCLVVRQAAYEAVFATLYSLEDPGVEDPSMLHEELLMADPSGLEGRRGSAETSTSQ